MIGKRLAEAEQEWRQKHPAAHRRDHHQQHTNKHDELYKSTNTHTPTHTHPHSHIQITHTHSHPHKTPTQNTHTKHPTGKWWMRCSTQYKRKVGQGLGVGTMALMLSPVFFHPKKADILRHLSKPVSVEECPKTPISGPCAMWPDNNDTHKAARKSENQQTKTPSKTEK